MPVHPRKDYHDDTITRAEREFRIRRYRAALAQWFADMDVSRGRTRPRSQREKRFCAAFALGVCYLMAAGRKFTKKQVVALAVAALDDGGYRAPKESKGLELLELPRVQNRVAEILAERGVDVAKAGDVLNRVMSDAQDNAGALAATELFFKVTTGFAVSKSAQLHGSARTDRFFDTETFANPPRPVNATSQEK